MANKDLDKRIKEIEKLLKRHEDDILQFIEKVYGTLEGKYKLQPHHEFKVGDRVQFKSWEEIEKEFGVNDCNGKPYINTYPWFIKDMEYLCGTYATISKIDGHKVELKDFTARADNSIWTYSLDMLKPATDEPKCKFTVGDKVIYKDKNVVAEIVEIYPMLSLAKIRYEIKEHSEMSEYTIVVNFEQIETYTEPCWTFTDDEKVILKNLPEKYKWIARDKDGSVLVSFSKPFKDEDEDIWDIDDYEYGEVRSSYIWQFNHLFQSIKWTDEEPCEFRKYL